MEGFTFEYNKCPICNKTNNEYMVYIWSTENGLIKGKQICKDCYDKIFGVEI